MIRKALITGAVAGLLTVMAPVHATSEKITLNFVNADINSVVQTVGQITGRNFLLDPRVKGTINIVSSNPVPRDQVYSVFLSSLRLQGYTTVDTPAGTKIVPEADAKQGGGILTRGRRLRVAGDRIITHVFPLQNESAAQVVPILRPLSSPNSVISAVPGSNTLIITDYADNVKRISRIIQNLDRPSQGDVAIVHLQNASALDLAQMVTRLMTDPAQGGQPADINRFSVVPDTRTNNLLVRSANHALINRVRQLVASLDVPSSTLANIHVVYLRNASAEKLAPTLRAVLAADNRTTTTASTGPTTTPSAVGSAPVAAATTQTALTSPNTGSIQADPATNSLIITAPDNVYNSLRSVIAQLDTRRAQIDVEALIVEVSSDRAAQLGIQWQNLAGIGKSSTSLFGGTNFTASGSSISNLSANPTPANIGNGLSLGLMKGVINFNGGQILNLGALAQALSTDTNANILSEPNLLTMDNEEASIIIGQNVPFITGSYAQASGTNGSAVNPFQTIERKDVGLSLKVKPQITEGGTVKLQISQEVSSVDPTSVSNPSGIITNKRAINSTVLVDDGQTIVLGGLMDDQMHVTVQGVPGLSKIPVVGNLFKSQSRDHAKTNLMVFLRPRIQRTASSYTGVTQERYDYIRNQQLQQQLPNTPLFPDSQGRVLPPLASVAPTQEVTKK